MSNDLLGSIKPLRLPEFPHTTDFFFWRYDDGTEAAAAIDQDDEEEIYSKIFDDKADRKQYQEYVQAQNKKKKLDFEKNKLRLRTGLKYAESAVGYRNDAAAAAKPHLLRMLEACGQDLEARTQMIQLFSALMAGYYFSFLIRKELFPADEPVMVCAPVLTCKLKDGVNDLLRDVVESLCVDTSDSKYGYGKLAYTQPCCLPTSPTDKKILDCAHIELGRSANNKSFPSFYPAQYRDTGVFLNTQFFSGADLLRFQKRNHGAALVLYGAKDQSLLTDPIRLDSMVLSQYIYQDNWDKQSVRRLVLHFVGWLKDRFDQDDICDYYRKKLRGYLQIIRQHNQKRGSVKIRKLKCLWLEAQLLALEEFSQFGMETGCWTVEEGSILLTGWNHLLLPECGPYPRILAPIGTPGHPILPEQDCTELFETVLTAMLSSENWLHFIYVPSKTDFEERVNDTEVWGYLREYQDKKSRERIPTLQIREVVFCKIAKRLSSVSCNWYEIIKHLRETAPPYMHPSKTTRMPGIGAGEKTLILKLDQLAFLPDEVNAFLLQRILFG